MAVATIYDACVLYSAPLRDLLLRLALRGLVRAHWSEQILNECFRSILKNRPDLQPASLERTRRLMSEAVPNCMVSGFEPLIDGLKLPDSNDRHVLAAAIAADAETIVTFNLADFPSKLIAEYGVSAVHPDQFLLNVIEQSPAGVLAAIREQAESLRSPPRDLADLLNIFEKNGLRSSVTILRELLGIRVPLPAVPLIAMDELQFERTMSKIIEPLHHDLLAAARKGRATVAVAAAILTGFPARTAIVLARDEAGDGEGTAPVSHVAALSIGRLLPHEELCLELPELSLSSGGVWSVASVREEAPVRSKTLSRIFNQRWVLGKLQQARAKPQSKTFVSVAVLTLRSGEQRVAYFDCELGDDQGRGQVASFVRAVRRTKLLKRGETIDRVLVTLMRSPSARKWSVASRSDPVKAR